MLLLFSVRVPHTMIAIVTALQTCSLPIAVSSHGHAVTLAFSEPGKASEASRTVEIVMSDNYFEPESLEIRAGETVRFVVKNEGEFLHEFNLGTAAMHAEHQEEMMAMMESGMMTAR